jgi:hypothetical protein
LITRAACQNAGTQPDSEHSAPGDRHRTTIVSEGAARGGSTWRRRRSTQPARPGEW